MATPRNGSTAVSTKKNRSMFAFLSNILRQDGPPDLDDLIRKWMKGPSKKQGPGGFSPKSTPELSISLKPILLVVFLIWSLLGIYIVQPAEQAVLLRFGSYFKTMGPGIHWAPPLATQRFIVDTHKIYDFSYDTNMLTNDENIVDVKLSVWFKVIDPKAFLFNVKTPTTSLIQATASSLRQVVGRTTLDDILTTGRATATANIQKELTSIFSRYNTGIEIQDLNLQPAKPPEAVTDAFDDAIKAREDEQRYINEAQAFSEQTINKAQGKAARIGQEANAYKERVILDAKAEVAPFLALLSPYHRAPKLTQKRLSLETMEQVFSDVNKLIVPDNVHLTYLPGLTPNTAAQDPVKIVASLPSLKKKSTEIASKKQDKTTSHARSRSRWQLNRTTR